MQLNCISRFLKKTTSFVFVFLVLSLSSYAQKFQNISPNSNKLKAYDKFEVSFDLPKTYNNPYDYNEIAVSAIFTNPNGKTIEVPGFWYQNYTVDEQKQTVTSSGEAKWIIRFTPPKAGKWSYVLKTKDAEDTLTSKSHTFDVAPAESNARGFIRIHPEHHQYFYYEHSGASFFGSGLNSDINFINKSSAADPNNKNWGSNSGYHPQWSGSPTKGLGPEVLYKGYYQQVSVVEGLGRNGGKAIRINTDRYYHPIEAKAEEYPYDSEVTFGEMGFEIGKYHQGMCFILDKMYERSEQYGIGIMLTPWDAIAKNQTYSSGVVYAIDRNEELIKRRLRYTMARWGYSPSYWMTEYFNEFVHEKLDTFWLGIMAWQKSIDPYNHYTVLTNKIHGETGPDIFVKNAYREDCYKVEPYEIDTVPGVIGEFGESIWLGTKDPKVYDPNGNWVRQSLWNAVLSNWSGALTWWIKPLYGETGINVYHKIYPALYKFLEDENMAAEGPWSVMEFEGEYEGFEHIRVLANQNKNKTFLWIVRTPPSEVEDREALSGKWLEFELPSGSYKLEWWDSQKGEILSAEVMQTNNKILKIKIPNIVTRDIAAKIKQN